MKNFNFSDLILVKNPVTEKHINLMPLFNLAFQLTQKGEPDIKRIKEKIDETIRLIAVHRFEEESVEEYSKQLVFNLYQISDMFEEMENF